MKIKQIITLIVGITSVALSPITWAAGHGGGGGFGGGGFSGGHSGGGGGRPSGGGFHPGGSGFGRPAYYYSRGMGFANSRSHYTSAPWQNPVHRSQPVAGGQRAPINRPVTSNGAGNHVATSSATHPARTLAHPTFNGHVAERHNATNWHGDWDHRRAHFDHGRFFVFDDGFWFGLDPGFFPWDYYPYYAYDYYPYDYYPGYYADTEPYYYDNGAYSDMPMRDSTVTTVQTELTQLGYYNGPVDGIFGPTTRDAVAKYQIANQLSVTGSPSSDTLQSLGLPQAAAS